MVSTSWLSLAIFLKTIFNLNKLISIHAQRAAKITQFHVLNKYPDSGGVFFYITNALHISSPNIGATVQTVLSLGTTFTFCKQMIQLINLSRESYF